MHEKVQKELDLYVMNIGMSRDYRVLTGTPDLEPGCLDDGFWIDFLSAWPAYKTRS